MKALHDAQILRVKGELFGRIRIDENTAAGGELV